ncbi:MAG: DUF72 domain-containing protein [Deltaproteobacteria bacterium]|nr:DUF72 domain-containing protein [Deltaproteobacteria bacterium]
MPAEPCRIGAAEIRIGASGWSYPSGPASWRGIFYPRARHLDELSFYSQYFPTVEVNSTFYRPADPVTVARWAQKTPEGFDFCIKLWQRFTHPRMVQQAGGPLEPPIQAEAEQVRRALDPLAARGRLGMLLLQFPPSFGRQPENEETLRRLLAWFQAYPRAVELRHRSWSDAGAETRHLLEEGGASWVLIDEPTFALSVQQPFAATDGRLYLRFHGRNREKWWAHGETWERYDYLYREAELQPYARELRAAATAGEVRNAYVFFNNHPRAKGLANAFQFMAQLSGEPVTFPEGLATHYPQLTAIGKPDRARGPLGL